MRERGSILLETSFCLILVVFALLMCWEIIKRSMLETVLQHAVFMAARDYALGESQSAVEEGVRGFLYRTVGRLQTDEMLMKYQPFVMRKKTAEGDLVARLKVQYKITLPFYLYSTHYGRVIYKQHFEVTKECKFSLQ